METPIRLKKIMLLFMLFAGSVWVGVSAQVNSSAVKNCVEAREYVFHAQTALPTSGPSRHLTSDYELKIFNNSVTSYLPYFGRAYSLPYNSTEGGFNFTSTKFEYSVKKRKKGGWSISIKPKDVTDFREFTLTVSENGYGTLHAITNNRQPISYFGYVSPVK